ncbi:MAG: cobalamin-dependent protein [Magnetococcales bacterium]|nr:cobalamin-dependent protein [Magnetococcales bacterium]
MSKALLIVPHFWDTVCVPLGVSSLKAYCEPHGHQIALFDYNMVGDIFSIQKEYFALGCKQFPGWKNWNMARNGTETLALHQLVYLFTREQPNYKELCAEIVNVNGAPKESFMAAFDVAQFDLLFERLYSRVEEILRGLLDRHQPDVVGCSLYNSTWPATLFILKLVKKLRPATRTVVGGPGPIMGIISKEEEIQSFYNAHDCIDYYVVGEGEAAFLEILDNSTLPPAIVRPASYVKKLGELPLPDYGDLDLRYYLSLSIASARGCPYECSFCAETIFWKGFRSTSKALFFEKVKSLAEKYNRRCLYICDSLSNHIISSLTDLTHREKLPFKYDCYLRADVSCTHEDRAKLWSLGGLHRARLGMESASQRILDEMVKKTDVATMEKSLAVLSGADIVTSTLWIVGYPGETEEEFSETLSFIKRNKNHIHQADPWLFQFHPDGLAGSDQLVGSGVASRFSPQLNKLFAITPYVIGKGLSLQERFDRLERFERARVEAGISNPYSFEEWNMADHRWQELGHKRPLTLVDHMASLSRSR